MTHFFINGEHSARERRVAFFSPGPGTGDAPTPAVPEATNKPAEKSDAKTEKPLKSPDAQSVDTKAKEVKGRAESKIAALKGKLGMSNNKDGGTDIKASVKMRVSLPSGEKLKSGIKSTWEKISGKKGKGPDAKGPAKVPDTKAPDAKAPDAKSPDAKTPDAKAPDAKSPDAKAPDAKTPDAKAPDAKSPDAKAPDAKTPDAKAPDAKSPDAKTPDAKTPDAKAPDAKGEKSGEVKDAKDGTESKEKGPDTPRGKAVEATRKMLAENPNFKAKMEALRPMLDDMDTYNDMDPKAISLMRALDTSITLRLAKEGMSEEDIIAAKETIPFSPKGTADFMDEAGVSGGGAGVDKGGEKGADKGTDGDKKSVEGKEKGLVDQLNASLDQLAKDFPELKELIDAVKKILGKSPTEAGKDKGGDTKAESKDGPAKTPEKPEDQIRNKEAEIKANEGDIADIDEDLNKAGESSKTLGDQKKGIEKSLKELKADPKSSKADIRRMETNLKDVDAQIKSNGDRIKELKGQRQELVDANAKLKTEIDGLRGPDKKGPAEGGDKNKEKVDQAVKDLKLQVQPDGSFLRPGFTGRYTGQPDGTIFYAGGKGPDNTDRPPQTFTGMKDGTEQWDQTRSTPLADTKASDAKAPDAKAPDAKAPDAKTPDAKAPDAKLPDAKTPDAKAPDAKSPDAKTPDAKTPDAKAPDAKGDKPAEGAVDSKAIDGLKTALGALGDAVKVNPDGSAQIDLNNATDNDLVKAGMRAALEALGIPNDGGKINVTKENIQKITQAAPQVVDVVNKLRSGKLSELPKDVLSKVIASIDAQLPENMRGKVTIDGSNVVLDLGDLGKGKVLPAALGKMGVAIQDGKVKITPAQVAKVAGAIKAASGIASFLRPRQEKQS